MSVRSTTSFAIISLLFAVSLLVACREAREEREAAGRDWEAAGAPSRTPGEAREEAATGAAPQVVTAFAKDFTFAVPEPIPAGLTTIRLVNQGESMHHMQLYKLEQGKSVADLMEAVKALSAGGSWPEWAVPEGGPGGVMAGGESNATKELEAGSYALVCWVPDTTGVPHLMKGMVQAVEIAAPAADEAVTIPEPRADGTVTLMDYDFQFSEPLVAGDRTLRVENRGPQTHEIQMWRLSAGKSLADLMEYLRNNTRGEPPGGWVGGVSELEAGDQAYFTASLEPGEYALICFVIDQNDGKPHFMHGMTKQITVAASAGEQALSSR